MSCARTKYSKRGLELANSSTMRINSQSRSSAGVNQCNPIEAKGSTSIYNTKRYGLEAFQNHIRKTNPQEKKKERKQTKEQEETLQGTFRDSFRDSLAG